MAKACSLSIQGTMNVYLQHRVLEGEYWGKALKGGLEPGYGASPIPG